MVLSVHCCETGRSQQCINEKQYHGNATISCLSVVMMRVTVNNMNFLSVHAQYPTILSDFKSL